MGGLALVWLAVIGVQQLCGWPGWVVRTPVETSQIRPDPRSKGLWKAPIPRKYRSWLTDQRGVVLEEGVRIGRRSASISGVMKESGGIFSFHHGFVRWKLSDGSDPRKSGKPLALELPAPVPDWQVPLGVTGLLWAAMARRVAEKSTASTAQTTAGMDEDMPTKPRRSSAERCDFAMALAVLMAAAAVGLNRVPAAVVGNDGAMMINGLPYSDAACWYEMSVSLAEGRGLASAFDGQRPWYSVLIAMVHQLRGGLAVEHGLLVNALALAVGAAGLFVVGRLMGSRRVGLLAAAVLVVSQAHRKSGAALMTEMTGLALTVWSLALIMAALGQLGRESRPRWWAPGLLLGGTFQALGNLACPYTLAAMPLYGVLLWKEGRHWAGSWWHWRALLPGSCFVLGVLLILGPWVVRQHRVHGVPTISTQTGDLLYGATFEEGPMKPAQMKELYAHLDRVGHSAAERYKFGIKRFAETARADPWGYVKKLGGRTLAFFAYYNVTRPEPAAAALLLVLAGVWLRRGEECRWAWLGAGAVVAALAIWLIRLPTQMTGPGGLLGLAVGAAAVAWLTGSARQRRAVGWLAATLAGCALINGLTGNLIASRCWIFCDWTLWLIVLAAVHGSHEKLALLLTCLARRVRDGETEEKNSGAAAGCLDLNPEDLSGVRRFIFTLTAVLVLGQGVGSVMLWLRQKQPLSFAAAPQPDDLQRVKEWASREFPAVAAASGYPLNFMWVRLGEGACYLDSFEEATLFSRAFKRLSWPRTLRLVRGTPPGPGQAAPGAMVRIPGDGRDLPEDRPGLLVSWMSVDPKANLGHDEEIFEALAFLPSGPDGAVDETQAIRFMKIPVRPAKSVETPEEP